MAAKARGLWKRTLLALCLCAVVALPSHQRTRSAQDVVFYENGDARPVLRKWVPRWYVRTEYVNYWASPNDLPALLTTSPLGTEPADSGVLGEPATQVITPEKVADDGIQGGRLTFGRWFDDRLTRGMEAQFWAAGISPGSQPTTSATVPILARPFHNTQILEQNKQDAQLIAWQADQTSTPFAQGSFQIDPRAALYSLQADSVLF
jgi:hypothetical protein